MTRRTDQPPPQIRPGFLPGILGAVVAFVGTGLIGSDAYLIIRFAISILALILAVFAGQGRKWLWLIPLVALAVVWNPVVPFGFSGPPWVLAHIAAAAVFLVVAFFLRTPAPEAPAQKR
ncbi:DUF6804 family protein [Naasia aerilata]|uniref:DUF6804 family protein n=1 Tax=Naasia aerilata TaxID=1162966 RepID=UPI0025745559|nr:DUF6804 family protein [Naasia aerilata]